jgi:hypothetical protein
MPGAYAFQGRFYGDPGESALSAENTTKAYKLRQRASDAERFFITATYLQQVTGNLERAKETFELWEHTYPREVKAPFLHMLERSRSRHSDPQASEGRIGPDPAAALPIADVGGLTSLSASA